MRTIHLINGGLLALLLLGSALAWPYLPNSIPAHFGAGGQVTRWTHTSALSWFAIPLIAVALTAVNYWLASLLPRRPHLINFPGKEQFLALPPERRAPVIGRLREFLHGISASLIILMIMVQLTIYRTAQGEPSVAYTILILLGSFMLTPLILAVWLPRIQAEVDRQTRDTPTGRDR